MNCNQVNSISCAQLLEGLNIKFKRSGVGYLLSAPYRQDKNPSLYIVENRWKDLATGDHGRTLDLAARIFGLPISETLKKIDELFPGQLLTIESQKMNTALTESKSTIVILDQICDRRLKSYLVSRRIPVELANTYCREIHYSIDGKDFFTIGFENDAGGYATRNKYSKRCLGSNSITTLIRDESTLLVCEGFFDYLSSITINPIISNYSAIVMNSTANTSVCIDRIKNLNPNRIYVATDNDDAGRKSLEKIQNQFSNVIDLSLKYRPYKDVNDYLINRK
jgi:hypothetical protein